MVDILVAILLTALEIIIAEYVMPAQTRIHYQHVTKIELPKVSVLHEALWTYTFIFPLYGAFLFLNYGAVTGNEVQGVALGAILSVYSIYCCYVKSVKFFRWK